jgi:hypothetical protein
MLHIDNRHHAMKRQCKAHAMIFGMIQDCRLLKCLQPLMADIMQKIVVMECWNTGVMGTGGAGGHD